MMNPAIPDPIGELGRGVMRATEGMTPEQKIAYIQQNAASGIAPQSVLFLMMKQQERLRAAQPPMQSMPTVREKLAAVTSPMEQGLGAVPTGVMSSANYAGGGIVAFAEGGNEGLEPDPAAGISQLGYGAARAQLMAMIRQAEAAGQTERAAALREQYDKLGGGIRSAGYLSEGARRSMGMPVEAKPEPAAAPVEADMVEAISKGPSARRGPRNKPVDITTDKKDESEVRQVRPVAAMPASPVAPKEDEYATQLKRIEDLQKSLGIGEASSAYKALLDKEEAEAGKRSAQDRRMALAQAGFAMAEAAGRPGAKFLGSAAAAGQSYVANRVAADKADRDYQRTLARERMNLLRADEQMKMGNLNTAIQLQSQSEERAARARENAAKNNLAYYVANLEARTGVDRNKLLSREQNIKLMLEVSEQVADKVAALAMDPTYLKLKPEQQLAKRNEIINAGEKQLTGMLGLSSLGDTGKMSGFIFRGYE